MLASRPRRRHSRPRPLGSSLRFSSDGAAILFVPYAIVTAALWRAPPRTWWLYLLAASAGSLLPHLRDSGDISFVLLAEVADHARAVVAAIGLRWFAGEVRTLREIVAFLLVTALLAPSVGGLLGASLVTGYRRATDFVIAWEQWSLSSGEASTTASARAAGFHHHFVKPIDPERLRTLLDECARRQPPP